MSTKHKIFAMSSSVKIYMTAVRKLWVATSLEGAELRPGDAAKNWKKLSIKNKHRKGNACYCI
jgi:hypothetical protein